MNLFAAQEQQNRSKAAPLAVRMRPTRLQHFVGQQHFIGPGKLLRRLIEADRLQSAILYGPPGTGKTTLARIIANETSATFESLHAADASVRDIRETIERARAALETAGARTVLFLDEIHRFNKAQQDVLLRDVEDGILILIGATTENPFFAVNTPLISRSHVFQFESLRVDDLVGLLQRALGDRENGLGEHDVKIDDATLRFIAETADGDARRALSALEVAVLSQEPRDGVIEVTAEIAAESMQRKHVPYDGGDAHYDIASAFIKSMRGSDPDAALYWLARMLEGGEDPRFIARRIAICASEDVGTADSQALVVANAAAQVTQFVGLPECSYALAHATVYVATAPKSNAVTLAIGAAREYLAKNPTLPVPTHLRDKSYQGAKRLGHGKGYVYPHAHEEPIAQDYLGADVRFYEPKSVGEEEAIGDRLDALRAQIREKRSVNDTERAS